MLLITVVSQVCSSQIYQMQEPNLDIKSLMLRDECLFLKPIKRNREMGHSYEEMHDEPFTNIS